MLTFDLQDVQQNPTPFFEAILRGELIQLNHQAQPIAQITPFDHIKHTLLNQAIERTKQFNQNMASHPTTEQMLNWIQEGRL